MIKYFTNVFDSKTLLQVAAKAAVTIAATERKSSIFSIIVSIHDAKDVFIDE